MTVGESRYVKPDSALARGAEDLVVRHVPGDAGGSCRSCGQQSPCPSARHAAEVLRAAGLTATPNKGAFGDRAVAAERAAAGAGGPVEERALPGGDRMPVAERVTGVATVPGVAGAGPNHSPARRFAVDPRGGETALVPPAGRDAETAEFAAVDQAHDQLTGVRLDK